MSRLIPSFLGREIETLSGLAPEKAISYEEILQLGKGMDDRSRNIFLIFDSRNVGLSARFWHEKWSVWFRFGGFL